MFKFKKILLFLPILLLVACEKRAVHIIKKISIESPDLNSNKLKINKLILIQQI